MRNEGKTEYKYRAWLTTAGSRGFEHTISPTDHSIVVAQTG